MDPYACLGYERPIPWATTRILAQWCIDGRVSNVTIFRSEEGVSQAVFDRPGGYVSWTTIIDLQVVLRGELDRVELYNKIFKTPGLWKFVAHGLYAES